MKYYGVMFTKFDEPFKSAKGKIYYYKSEIPMEKSTAYTITANGYTYDNPVIICEIHSKSPDPSRDFKTITKVKAVSHYKPCLSEFATPEKVYFNAEAGTTCIIWEDGQKTLVRCCEEDIFDFEKGFAMAVLKHIYGRGHLNAFRKKFIAPAEKEYYDKLIGYDWYDEEDDD